jgi:hypothetical protein
VVLDGGAPVIVDLYAASYDRCKQKVYNAGYVADGSHTLSIYWIGQRYACSTSDRISVHAVDIPGTLSDAGRAAPIV